MAGTSSGPASLKEYLKKYTTSDDKEKKKKKKKKVKPVAGGVFVVDQDPVWQKPLNPEEDEEASADEEKPQVNEDIEVKRMRRLEQIKSKRPYGAISEDGSGWISVSDTPSTMKSEEQSSDISPPRKRRIRNDTPSPKPEQEDNGPADSDLSPPRKSHKHHRSPRRSERKTRFDTPSSKPYIEASEYDRGRDLSPPRRRQRDKQPPLAVDSDISPPRRSSRDSRYQGGSRTSSVADLSPPRRSRNERSSSIASSRRSVSRLDNKDTSDAAPPSSDLSPPRRRRNDTPVPSHRPKTGLVSGRDVKEEIDKTKREDWLRFNALDPSVSGRGAEVVYRDKKTGERMSKEEFLNSQKKERKKDEKPKEIKLEWGKGLAQKREAEARLQDMETEKDKPFSRSRDDPDLDTMLKERVRWGDPMAHLVKKKQLEPVLADLGDNEKMKESGFIVPQEVPSHSWIRRGLEAAPNRYGIKPGRHWDGVDRSTGYEKEMFKRSNEKQATDREAYLWSVAEM